MPRVKEQDSRSPDLALLEIEQITLKVLLPLSILEPWFRNRDAMEGPGRSAVRPKFNQRY